MADIHPEGTPGCAHFGPHQDDIRRWREVWGDEQVAAGPVALGPEVTDSSESWACRRSPSCSPALRNAIIVADACGVSLSFRISAAGTGPSNSAGRSGIVIDDSRALDTAVWLMRFHRKDDASCAGRDHRAFVRRGGFRPTCLNRNFLP